MSSLADFYTQLDAVIRADAGVQAWLASTAPGATWSLIEGNLPVKRIESHKIPGIGYEIGDAEVQRQTNGISEISAAINVFFVWHEDDHSAAFSQRQSLIEHMVSALMDKPTLNDAVAGAWIEGMTPDRNIFHPRHSLLFDVAGVYEVSI